MAYYIFTTAKFAQECINSRIYGSTNSNWLANVDRNDTVFISQFNSKSQDLYGPFRVTQTLFYDKSIIFPNQKFYFRVALESEGLRMVDEVFLYLRGIENRERDLLLATGLISLIQQNKHLHSIGLTDAEGQFLLETLQVYGRDCPIVDLDQNRQPVDRQVVDTEFLEQRNTLLTKGFFKSESDLEAYILLKLKDIHSGLYRNFTRLLERDPGNSLANSSIMNQFVLGNAYPADIVIISDHYLNVFELKKDALSNSSLPAIRKEMQKHCYYSLYSHRLPNTEQRNMNFFLVVLRAGSNIELQGAVQAEFRRMIQPIARFRECTLVLAQYHLEAGEIVVTEI